MSVYYFFNIIYKVTGGNKGIGYAIVKGLCEKFDGTVYLTARDAGRGKAAVEELNKLSLKPEFHQLDVDSEESIRTFAKFLKEKHGGLDVLVNNAAIAFKDAATEPFGYQAEMTLKTNYFSFVKTCSILFPLLRPHGRVVNISSSAGHLLRIPSAELRKKFSHPHLTVEKLSSLMNSFIEAAKHGDHLAKGWPNSAYAVSKVGVSALTVIQQREFDKDRREDLVVNCCHPGYVDTDMTSHKGHLTIEEGARAPLVLALLPPNIKEPRGAYVWKDGKPVDWKSELKENF